MASLSSLSTNTTSITALSNVALVIPNIVGLFASGASPQNTVGYQPQNNPNTSSLLGITPATQPALLFHYEGEQTVVLESDITDHYVEDNTAIQDQIALKPEVVTTHGFIGELNDVPPAALAPLLAAANVLTPLGAYAPGLSVTALEAYNTAFQLYQTANNAVGAAVSAISSLSGTSGTTVINGTSFTPLPHQNKQQTMFQSFYGYWLKRTLFTIQTPWAIFQNMAIQSLRAIQDADSPVITDFEVKFKLIRMASTAVSTSILNGRLSSQAASAVQNGTQTPTQTTGVPGVTSGSP
jgi:hypothetical protein